MNFFKLVLFFWAMILVGCNSEKKEESAPKKTDEAYERIMDQKGAKDYLEKMSKEK